MKGLSNLSIYFGSYVSYLILFIANGPQILSTVKIIGTLQAIILIKETIFQANFAISFYYSLVVIFERICDVINI